MDVPYNGAESRPPSESSREAVGRALADAAARARRGLRLRIGLGAALLGALTAWGVWLHGQVESFRADDAAVLARQQVAAALPAARQELSASLRAAAPEVAGRAVGRLLGAPAYLRRRVESHLLAEVDPAANQLESKLRDEVREDIRRLRTELDVYYPASSDEEKLERFTDDFLRRYRARLDATLAAPVAPYRTSMEDLRQDLDRLGEDAGLDEKERLQREIVATFLELHARARERGDGEALPKDLLRLPGLAPK